MNTSDARIVLSNGRTIFFDPDDQRGQRLARDSGNLNPLTLTMWEALLCEQAWTHVVDVGANYGEMLVNPALPPQAQIIAIEPNDGIRRYLTRTLHDAGIAARIVSSAISDSNSVAHFLADRIWSGTSRMARANEVNSNCTLVETTTLDTLLGVGKNLDGMRLALKVDVEGHEVAVLRGAAGILARASQYAALVEVLHLEASDREWLLQHFDLYGLAVASKMLDKLKVGTLDQLDQVLTSGEYYKQDLVIRSKI